MSGRGIIFGNVSSYRGFHARVCRMSLESWSGTKYKSTEANGVKTAWVSSPLLDSHPQHYVHLGNEHIIRLLLLLCPPRFRFAVLALQRSAHAHLFKAYAELAFFIASSANKQTVSLKKKSCEMSVKQRCLPPRTYVINPHLRETFGAEDDTAHSDRRAYWHLTMHSRTVAQPLLLC